MQNQLRRRLRVVEAAQPVVGMLAVENAERRQQLRHIQAACRVHVPGGVHVQAVLQHEAQLPRHHLAVDRVRHARRGIRRQQAEIPRVLQVGRVVPRLAAAQHRLHHAPHAILLQLVRQLVQMRPAFEDQPLARRVDVVLLDGQRPVLALRPVLEARQLAQRVHQPRLPPGLLPHRVQRRRREPLPGLLGVLLHQALCFLLGEVAQPQGLGGDVERAAAGDHFTGA